MTIIGFAVGLCIGVAVGAVVLSACWIDRDAMADRIKAIIVRILDMVAR